jgi:DNA-binding MarR family transcriptional regulator
MEISPEHDRDFVILEHIEKDPDANQATLAALLGIAIGTVNWHLKRLVQKGYVKVRRLERKKLRYIITAEGIALRTRLTVDYIQTQFRLYRYTRQRMLDIIAEGRREGWQGIRLEVDGEQADICRLTCLEQRFPVMEDEAVPLIRQEHGWKLVINPNSKSLEKGKQ